MTSRHCISDQNRIKSWTTRYRARTIKFDGSNAAARCQWLSKETKSRWELPRESIDNILGAIINTEHWHDES